MKQAKWIWYNGDYEIYHHLLLSCRRQEKGVDYPCQWHISRPEASVSFKKDFTAEKDGIINVRTHSKGMVRFNGSLLPVNSDIYVEKGEHDIRVELYDIEKFPSLYINSDILITDETWLAECFDRHLVPVGCDPKYLLPDDDPSVFPFMYEIINPVSAESTDGGILYDFGKETFGPVTIKNSYNDEAFLIYGESLEEALDPENAIIRDRVGKTDCSVLPARAFRYIFVKADKPEMIHINAKYEYLPLEDKAHFSCDNGIVSEIWDLCAYTFHLNSREFFLDGIKRDRWVWSGDAYQSFMISQYLYNDPSVTKRTITAVFGKPPYKTHINTINDYSAYLIISVLDYYKVTGDMEYINFIFPKVKELFKFIVSRLSENGYVIPRHGDWIFIDWGELDKNGPHCFEQILLWKLYLSMTELSTIYGDSTDYTLEAELLKSNIINDFWDEEKGAFIDSFTSGKRFVSRQTNILAVMYDFITGEMKERVIENGILNPELPLIKTPYFKLYELITLCKIGRIKDAQDYIESYWGGMINNGATTVWEEFDPSKNGAEHYAMYGSAFGKSLCHAWGSGPILILCRFCAGVYSTSAGMQTFNIEPDPGKYSSFSADIPVRDGKVSIKYTNPSISIITDVSGGTFIHENEKIKIDPGVEYNFKI